MNARSCGVGGGGAISGWRMFFRLKYNSCVALLLVPFLGLAQVTITEVERPGDGTLRLMFRSENMVSTNYSIEFRSDLNATNVWRGVSDSTFFNVGGDLHQVDLQSITNETGFYRILSPEELRAWFDAATVDVDEGGGTIDLLVRFNGHFQGMLLYGLEGTGTNSIGGATGGIPVDGTSATIRLTLEDNATIDPLRYIVISLLEAPGLLVGSRATANVNIGENDAIWQGILETDTGTLGFELQILDEGVVIQSTFAGGTFGFFPANPVPATVMRSDDQFSAIVNGIQIPAEATLLETPMQLYLELFAEEPVGGSPGEENITRDRIEGSATLAVEIPAMPHLSATNHGTFVLKRPPVSPDTNDVTLVNAP